MEALKVGHLRGVTGFHQRLKARLHQGSHAAAEHGLLAEEVRFRLFLEIRFDDPGAGAADARRIGQGHALGHAGRILSHGDKARHPAALGVGAAHRMPRTLGRDHNDVHVGLGLDEREVDVEAMTEGQGRPSLKVRLDGFPVDRRLKLVRGEHHHHIGIGDRVRHLGNDQTCLLSLGPGARALAQPHDNGDAGILQVIGVGVALRPVTNDRHFTTLNDR